MFLDSVERVDAIDLGADPEARTFRVEYRTAFGVGSVEVVKGTVDRADWEPLRLRRRIIIATGLSGVISARAALADYDARHLWFATYGAGSWVFVLAVIAAVAAAWSVLGWSLPAFARTAARTWLPTGLCAMLLLAAASVARAVTPQGQRASLLLAEGAVVRARLEADAALVADPADPEARSVVDALRLVAARSAPSVAATFEAVKEPWFSRDMQAKGEAGRIERQESARSRAYAPLLCCDGRFRPAALAEGRTGELEPDRGLAVPERVLVRRHLVLCSVKCDVPHRAEHVKIWNVERSNHRRGACSAPARLVRGAQAVLA